MPYHDGENSQEEMSWPVRIFRYTECHGWQKQAGNGNGTIEASPRKNCIVIPTLHQKFSLSNNANDKGTVIRRNNCILLLSRTRTKAMVLQFSSLQHCLAFSDRFVKLNPPIDEFVCPSQTDSGSFFGQLAHRESILAHVVRLLHDPDFESFVSNIEATLNGSTDGTQMLHSWVDRDLSQAENGTQL